MPLRLLALVLLAAPLVASAQSDPEAAAAALETALVPSFGLVGEDERAVGIELRMAEVGVPGVSIAFVDGGEVVWTRTYGVADVASGTPVTPETRFQAASISKPVAATAALDLVEDGRLALDAPINEALSSWQVPASDVASGDAVTLRGLLTHTAGLTVSGFPGYEPGAEVPSTVGVLTGAGTTDPVEIGTVPRTAFDYSGGGYTVAQLAVEDVTGRPFADVLSDRVLGPLGMTHSTFAQPLPEALRTVAATGYRSDGTVVGGRFHTYPEQAAAGLWTTPSDLARWAIAMQVALSGGDHPVLDAATVRAMVAPDAVGGYGLGPGLETDIGIFGHGGANAGFRCQLTVQLDGGQGVVVMTNSDSGGTVLQEVILTLARAYGWAGPEPLRKAAIDLSGVARAAFAGRFQAVGRPELVVEMRVAEDGLEATRLWDGVEIRFAAESATAFFDRRDGTPVVFDDAEGMAFRVQGLRFERIEE